MSSPVAWIYALAFTLEHFLTGSLAANYKLQNPNRVPVIQRILGRNPEMLLKETDPAFHSIEEVNGFRQAVLIGNYGGMGPPKNKNMMKFGPAKKRRGSMAGRAMMGMGGDSNIDPNSMIELRDGHQYPYQVIVEGIKTLMDDQKQIKARSAGGKGGGPGSTLMDCMSKLASCAVLPVSNVQCYVECMMGNPLLKKIRHVFVHHLIKMCEPISTIFERVVERLDEKLSTVKLLAHYIKLFAKPSTYPAFTKVHGKSMAYKAVEALHMHMSSQMMEPSLAPQRRCLRPIKRSLELADKSFTKPLSLMNEGCKNISYMESTKQVIDMMEQQPRTTDMMLRGYHLSQIISQTLPGLHQLIISVFHDIVNLVTGTPCGIIPYAETGTKVDCSILREKPDTPTPVLPPQLVAPDPYKGACETIPEFPSFDMNMGFKFPKMDENTPA